MSSKLGDEASYAAGPIALIKKQAFHRVPKIPSSIKFDGKTAIVTGASGGLGLECARQFLQLGASRVVLAVRSNTKGVAAQKQLLSEFPKATIDISLLDMESDNSIKEFAKRCEILDRLDAVVLNAGCGKTNYAKANNGESHWETMLQVNYLGTMLLATLLIPILRKSKVENKTSSPGRISIVGSDMSLWTKLEESGSILEQLNSKDAFDGMDRYSKSKLLITMGVSKLAPAASNPEDVIVNVVNPGSVRGTDLMRDAHGQYMTQAFVFVTGALLGRNLRDGTRQYIHSALVLGPESHGSYGDWAIRPYPALMYTDAGRRIVDKVWTETLQALEITNL